MSASEKLQASWTAEAHKLITTLRDLRDSRRLKGISAGIGCVERQTFDNLEREINGLVKDLQQVLEVRKNQSGSV